MVELGMVLQVDERRVAGLLVASRVEREAVPLPRALVALRPELRSRSHEREVDVEENGAQRHASSSSQRAACKWGSSSPKAPDQA
ncbi:MAG TPA: hypothetical protein VM690_04610, partial [Gaiellaceae bacterium]|nr:hypothetical protein [Gaiellaceae bacterium]